MIISEHGYCSPAQTSQRPPADGQVGSQVNLYYHLEDFANALAVLSEEKVVYLLYNGAGAENGIQTSPEALGNVM